MFLKVFEIDRFFICKRLVIFSTFFLCIKNISYYESLRSEIKSSQKDFLEFLLYISEFSHRSKLILINSMGVFLKVCCYTIFSFIDFFNTFLLSY